MHIEPGIVNEAKMVLSYATAAGSVGLIFKHTIETLRQSNIVAFAVRSVLAIIATFIFFEILPKFSVGVSEVHFIFGSTLFLLFGAALQRLDWRLVLRFKGCFSHLLTAAIFHEYNDAVTSAFCAFLGCKADNSRKHSLC